MRSGVGKYLDKNKEDAPLGACLRGKSSRIYIVIGGVAEWLRRSVANHVRPSVLGSSPTVGAILPQANGQLSCPSFRGR